MLFLVSVVLSVSDIKLILNSSMYLPKRCLVKMHCVPDFLVPGRIVMGLFGKTVPKTVGMMSNSKMLHYVLH